ncbi:cysteine hydrolase [Parasalinivibrio latis]|uniref:cysteine hydrolase n=1 Tax=Parasalinivibrio latis TaxID=2952610 RepID=UPI0030E1791B
MKKALVVIDFINDIVDPQGKIPSCAAMVANQGVIAKANTAIQWARKNRHPVIFVKVGFHSSYADQPKQSAIFGKAAEFGALDLGGWGTDFHKDLDYRIDDLLVVKPRVNPFYNTTLDSVLRANRVEEVYFCGVSTSWAIQSAVRDAHDRDYQAHLVIDACAAHSADAHRLSLEMLERIAVFHTAESLC